MLLRNSLSSCIGLLCALTFAGCGGGGSSAEAPTQALHNASTTVQGTVVKGIVRGGLVNAYKLKDGSIDTLLASSTTDESGQFSFQFSDYSGPVYVEVTANSAGSWMVCDSGSGCGEHTDSTELDKNSNGLIDFGEEFKLGSDFSLTAALDSEGLTTPFSVTTLTHLAAQLAHSYPQGMNEISIAVARSQLEDLFGVSGIASSKIINLADPDAIANAGEQQLKQTLLSSALIGMGNETAFPQLLNALVYQLQSQGGQMITHSADGNRISLADLIDEAMKTARMLELDNLASSFQITKTNLWTMDAGSLTEAKPSPTAAGDKADLINAFINDLNTWQGYLSLSPDQTSFANVVSSIGVSTGADLNNMMKAVALAGQYGPVVALPDAALSTACNSLGNALTRMTCHLLISGKSLQDICEGSLNLVIFNRSLCDVLNDLTLPLGNGLKGNFALYDGIARIYGTTLDGVEIDITFTALSNSGTSYAFSVSGTADTDTGALAIQSGEFALTFEGGLDIKNLKLPETARGEIEVSYQQFADSDSGDSTSFAGSLAIDLDLSGVRKLESDAEHAYAGLDSVDLSLIADGAFESIYGDHFNGSLNLSGGLDSDIRVIFETDLPDYSDRATVSLISTPEKLSSGAIEDISISWGGKRYDVMYFMAPSYGTRISNQDSVIMDLDLTVEDGETAGYIYHNGTRYARVSPLNGSLLLELSDGTEQVL
ncbi:MAG: hypothetical protein WBA20_21420 [Ketobacter sp.]